MHAFVFSPTPVVQIYHKGEVVYQDTSVYGVADKPVILECGTTVPDIYIWSFTKPGTEAIRAVVYNVGQGTRTQNLAETLGKPTVISNSSALRIETLPLAAHGLFTCQAFYDIGQEAKVYYYYVHLIPYVLMNDTSPVEGSAMWMHCSVENGTNPILYMWQHETLSGNITTFAQGNSSIINMISVNRSHTGWYSCVASNAVNNKSSDRLWLDIIYGPDIPQIDVSSYNRTERGYSALETQTVSLLCQAKSNPASQYVWFYNSSQYNITKILRRHSGNYTCLAQNTYLNTRSVANILVLQHTFRVPVTKPYLLLSDVSPVEGSTMWMRCNLENGTGPIQYEWQHETRSGNITIIAQGNNSIINVTDVNRNHTGWYRCVASNAVNSESSNRLWLDTICELPNLNHSGSESHLSEVAVLLAWWIPLPFTPLDWRPDTCQHRAANQFSLQHFNTVYHTDM
uniref:Ig-like domain-containing protein n=1 Tax=Amphilophus citrinellus TaxID=61819 RepID=A0A3Q0R4I4_AMPCI